MRRKLFLVLLILAVLVPMCLFTVDRTEFVYVTQFGRHVATYDGAKDDEAGLHVRWPWPIQSLTRIDRRLQVLDLPAAELVTEDPGETGSIDKTLAIDAYVVWRVPDSAAVERFILTVGTPERAREILRDRFRGRLGAVIASGMKFNDLVSDSPGRVEAQRQSLHEKLMPAATPGTPPENGIEVVDVRLRRLNYPQQVRQSIFDRIISERNRKAAISLSQGRTEAENIRSETDAKITVALAEAQSRNQEKRAAADAEADRILNRAVSKDPDYYAELKQRELGDLALDKKVKVWSTQLFKMFFPAMPERRTMPSGIADVKPKDEGR
jgi:membrane protease subunit HflC